MTTATLQTKAPKDRNLGIAVSTEMANQLEALRRQEGERSISAVIRKMIAEGFEARAASAS